MSRFTRGRRRGIPQLKTLLIVGEGECDAAFLWHLKSLYDGRTKQKVKIRSSDGGCPHDIVHDAIKERHAQYDRRVVLLDSDIPIQPATMRLVKEKSIELIKSSPHCLEGMLLRHLNESIPENSQMCKTRLQDFLIAEATKPEAYSRYFNKDSLDTTTVEEIQILIKIISNSS